MSAKDFIMGMQVAGSGAGSGGGTVVIPNINATATTLPAGSDATVTKTGSNTNVVFNFGIPQGDQGNQGPAGQGVPTGGTTGQVLAKSSNDDYATEWVDQAGGGSSYTPGNGITIDGQTLSAKLSGQEGNTASFAEDGGIFVPESVNLYTAGDGIEINEQTIQAKISSQTDNSTGILNGAIYTPATFQTTVMPMIAVTTVPATPDVQVTASKGDLSVSGTTGADGKVELEVEAFGVWTISGTLGGKLCETTIVVSQIQEYTVSLYQEKIYGVSWDLSSTNLLSRTNDATFLSNPIPAVDNGSGSSPFDIIYPWSQMQIVSDELGNQFVKIPKFYYKISLEPTAYTFQISAYQYDGFSTSPLHMDRGDGNGEADLAYVARYFCGSSFTSQSGETINPVQSTNDAITGCASQESGYQVFAYDTTAFFTISMLYLVEFANWNIRNTIGPGNTTGSAITTNGGTDSMTYHTGRTSNGYVQYRNLEFIYGNYSHFLAGFRANPNNKIYICLNPQKFLNSYNEDGYVELSPTGVSTSSWGTNSITSFANDENFPFALISTSIGGTNDQYTATVSYFAGTGDVLTTGNYGSPVFKNYGMFGISTTNNVSGFAATRLVKIEYGG